MVVYELDGLQRPLPLSEVVPVTATQDGFPQMLSESAAWARATLTIQYPHPTGQADFARATLRLSSLRDSEFQALDRAGEKMGVDLLATKAFQASVLSTQPTRDDELWILDLPRQQLDLLLTDLQQQGFFQSQSRNQLGTRLSVELDQHKLKKDWSPEPRLDQFMMRVYREGQLSGLLSHSTPEYHSQPHPQLAVR